MKLTFHGAARSVTGSRHLLEVNGQRILLDCGLVQGHDTNGHRNHLSFDPRDIHAVVLSHAHIDHSGALPLLVRHGYTGRIHATPATVDLARILLEDSAHIQQQDAMDLNNREERSGSAVVQPLYTVADARQTSEQFLAHPYGHAFEVADGVMVRFRDAGHILGSAFVEMDIRERGQHHRLVFSGDIGRATLPIIRPPDPPELAETLIMESTYGDRDHPPQVDVERTLGRLVTQVAEQGGKILIPAFAVGRIQQLTFTLNNLWNHGDIPEIPVFVDSPLALQATEVFCHHAELWRKEMVEELRQAHDPDAFGFDLLKYVGSPEESRELNDYIGPAIIIAASGMCEGGRIVHHLAYHLQNPHNVVLLMGYQAEGTLGRRLLNGEEAFNILGREVRRRAAVLQMTALSAHAGRTELQAFYARYKRHNKHLFIVHGEPAPAEALAAWARQQSTAHVAVPSLHQEFEV